MTLSAGTRLGPYDIVAAIGAGGMGEVYRARDTRLNRTVALKVLSGAGALDPAARERFTREAHAIAALNHPNICVLHDIGSASAPETGGAPLDYLVMEYLDGETLAHRLRGGPLPLEQALEIGAQVAEALARAHRQGIVHRDLKPGNIMLTKAGAGLQAKLLDFGLAKLRAQAAAPGLALSALPTEAPATTPGMVLGTVPYMAPEQLEGKDTDARTDLFAFGAVLYEMLTGRGAFRGETAASIITAIMSSEPPPIATLQPVTPPALDRLLRRCLAKDPDVRCDSAHEVADELRWIRETGGGGEQTAAKSRTGRRRPFVWAAAILAALVVGGGASAWYVVRTQTAASASQLTFQRMTYRRGWVSAARFMSDEHTVVYSAEWDGGTSDLFTRRIERPESKSLGHPSGELLAASSTDELALAFDYKFIDMNRSVGTLKTVPVTAGTPRYVDKSVTFADWSPDGKQLAIVRRTDTGNQLEFPPGTVLYQTPTPILNPRVSRAGDRVAFVESGMDGAISRVAVVDRKRQLTVLDDKMTPGLTGGLAWSPSGDEVWYGALRNGFTQELRAVTLTGRKRLLYSDLVSLRLLDVSKDGRVLVATDRSSGRNFFRRQGDSADRELSWLDFSIAAGLSSDGRRVLIEEEGESAPSVEVWANLYLRDTSGKEPELLGPGFAGAFSAQDTVVATRGFTPPGIVLYSTASAWSPVTIAPKDVMVSSVLGLLPSDDQVVVFVGNKAASLPRIWRVRRDGTDLQPITPEGVVTPAFRAALALDGRSVLGVPASVAGSQPMAYPIAGGEPRPLNGLGNGEEIVGWGADRHSFYAFHPGEQPIRIYKVDDRTGARILAYEIVPTDRAGRLFGQFAHVTPDGKACSYSTVRWQSDLYMIQGLK